MCSPCTRPARTPRTREASTTSWRGCALLRSKLPTSQVQHCNYHHHRGSCHGPPASHQYTSAVSSVRDLGQGKGRHVEHSRKNLILSLQNTKSNVAALLRVRSQPQVIKKNLFCES